jgi:hypothetical protein
VLLHLLPADRAEGAGAVLYLVASVLGLPAGQAGARLTAEPQDLRSQRLKQGRGFAIVFPERGTIGLKPYIPGSHVVDGLGVTQGFAAQSVVILVRDPRRTVLAAIVGKGVFRAVLAVEFHNRVQGVYFGVFGIEALRQPVVTGVTVNAWARAGLGTVDLKAFHLYSSSGGETSSPQSCR